MSASKWLCAGQVTCVLHCRNGEFESWVLSKCTTDAHPAGLHKSCYAPSGMEIFNDAAKKPKFVFLESFAKGFSTAFKMKLLP